MQSPSHWVWKSRWQIEAHNVPEFLPEIIIETGEIRRVYRDKPDAVFVILCNLPAHRPYVVVPGSFVRDIDKAPIFNVEVVLRKVEVRSAYLGSEDEPVISRRLGFILVGDVVAGKVIRDHSLAFAPHILASERD